MQYLKTKIAALTMTFLVLSHKISKKYLKDTQFICNTLNHNISGSKIHLNSSDTQTVF